jgi:hypothetical protein
VSATFFNVFVKIGNGALSQIPPRLDGEDDISIALRIQSSSLI